MLSHHWPGLDLVSAAFELCFSREVSWVRFRRWNRVFSPTEVCVFIGFPLLEFTLGGGGDLSGCYGPLVRRSGVLTSRGSFSPKDLLVLCQGGGLLWGSSWILPVMV